MSNTMDLLLRNYESDPDVIAARASGCMRRVREARNAAHERALLKDIAERAADPIKTLSGAEWKLARAKSKAEAKARHEARKAKKAK